MSKTVVVFGSSTGTCEGIANKIGEKLGAEVVNVSDMNEDTLAADNLIIGTSTWGAGELQDDWYEGVELYNAAKSAGATLVGAVATDGYSFDDSEAVVGGQFVGLALDDINEDDKTDGRIDAWITQIQPSLK